MTNMKNIFRLIQLVTLLLVFQSGVHAQAGKTTDKPSPTGDDKVKMAVSPVVITGTAPATNLAKPASTSLQNPQGDIQVVKPIVAPVSFQQKPANMQQVLPKDDVKPVLPSTMKMPDNTPQPAKIDAPVKMGPKLAPVN